jgi:hypothetical protein
MFATHVKRSETCASESAQSKIMLLKRRALADHRYPSSLSATALGATRSALNLSVLFPH